jgi:F-type H+-transporting ATPase subunit a
MITGHILAKVCVGFIWVAYLKGTSLLVLTLPLLLLTLFLGLELLIAYLQAYIFTFITCITIKDMAYNINGSIFIPSRSKLCY